MRASRAALLAPFFLLGSCGGNGVSLVISVITDFVPGVELATVRIDLEGQEPGDVEPFFSTRLSFVPSEDDDFVRGVDVARLTLPRHGAYTVSVSLLDRSGAVLARRDLPLQIEEDTFSTTVLVTRSCVGVACPGPDGAPDETVCLGGRCVTPECAADPASCPDACTLDAQCTSPVACARGACVRGVCLVAPLPEGTPGACVSGEVCDPTEGCVPVIPTTCEDDAERRCEHDDGVCAGASVRCEHGFFPECGTDEYGVRFQPTESLCDGLDNDCDGATDEMPAPLCPLQLGTCAASARVCAGAGGYLACDYAAHSFLYETVETTCDAVDNDCDGNIDEAALTALCPLQDGVCGRSRARCVNGSLVCEEADYGALYEIDETECDGLDNDCDGRMDEALTAPSCALTSGVCDGSTSRCRGTAGWSSCGAAEYGASYEAVETRCDGLDNDCDGTVDEGITRACDVGCGPGVATCEAGVFVDCTAPIRTALTNVTLSGGTYAWECLDIPLGASVRFGEGAIVSIAQDLSVVGTMTFEGRGGRIVADSARISGRVIGGELTFEVAGDLRIDEGGVLDGIGRYSGGGGGACSALSSSGITGGGAGGANGGDGGRGGGCVETAGLLGGEGVGGGTDGGVGCGCTCSVIALGAGSGGDGALGSAAAGGGGGAGARGGGGGSGALPYMSWTGVGGSGGDAAQTSGRPTFGGGGGGAGGGQIGFFGPACGRGGGGGGAIFVLRAGRVLNSGRIAVDGTDGVGGLGWMRYGASGGGGAGAVVIETTLFDNIGIVTAAGGRGGSPSQHTECQGCLDTSAGGGGGGGGGYVYMDVDSLGAGSLSRISVGGGAGGTVVCASPVGVPGSDGIRCCTTAIAGCSLCP